MTLCDAHCHCHLGRFYDRKNLKICSCGVNLEDWIVLEKLRLPDIKKAYGLHPYYANTKDAFELTHFLKKANALGEIGLDLSQNCTVSLEVQLETFNMQLGLAEDLKLPVILHNVNAYTHIKDSLKKCGLKKIMFHAAHNFGEILPNAYYSFGIRELESPKILNFARKIPFDRILIEGDALPNSVILKLCLEKLSVLKSINREKFARIISQNFDTFFTS